MALNKNNFDELLNPPRTFLSQIASVVLQRSVRYLTTTFYLISIVRKFSKVFNDYCMVNDNSDEDNKTFSVHAKTKRFQNIFSAQKFYMKHGTLTNNSFSAKKFLLLKLLGK